MKLLRRTEQQLVFTLSRLEQEILRDLLGRYPVLRADFQPLSREANPQDPKHQANQQMLVEALAAQKAEHCRMRDQFLAKPDRLRQANRHWELRLETAEVEWLLQVLNDVRVGCWERAGCPEEHHFDQMEVTEQNARDLFLMEMSGFFQHEFLEALGAP